MNRTASLLVAMVLAALCASVWLLTRDDSDRGDATRLTRPIEEQPAPAVLPDVGVAGAAPPAPEPIDVPTVATGIPSDLATSAPAPSRRIAGRVVRLSDGTPVSGVTVRAEGLLAPGIVVQARTSMTPAGTFVLESVPTLEVRFDLGIAKPGFRRSGHQMLPAGVDDVADLELVFDTGFAIEGFVTDDTGRVLPGAVVEAGDAQVVRTDANGRFLVLDALPRGDEEAVHVTATAPWHQRVSRELHAPDDHREVPELTLELPGSGVIEGRVLRADGRVVPDTWVRVAFEMTDRHGKTAQRRLSDDTDAQGGYRIDHVPPGRYVMQAGATAKQAALSEQSMQTALGDTGATPAGLNDATWIVDVVVQSGEVTPLDVVLPPVATLRGRVTESSGAPVVDARLSARSLMRWPAPAMNGSSVTHSDGITITSNGSGDGAGTTVLSVPEMTGRTDARGDYELPFMTPGEIQLAVSDPTGRLRPAEPTTVLPPGATAVLDVVLESGMHVRGVVVDGQGQPIEDAAITVTDPEVRHSVVRSRTSTDAEGRFDIGGLTPGEKRLQIGKEGFVSTWVPVEPGARDGRWTLLPAPVIRGRVVDARTGEVLHDFDVTIATENMTSAYTGDTYDEGRFAYDVDDDGSYTVTIEAAGYREQSREGIVPSTTEAAPLLFRMDPGT